MSKLFAASVIFGAENWEPHSLNMARCKLCRSC